MNEHVEQHSGPSASDMLEGSLTAAALAVGLVPEERQWCEFLRVAGVELRKRGIGGDTRRSVA